VQVVDCFCGSLPWMHCEALAFTEFNTFVSKLPLTTATSLAATPSTRRLQSVSCGAMTDLGKMIFNSAKGCIGSAYCNVGLLGSMIKVHANISVRVSDGCSLRAIVSLSTLVPCSLGEASHAACTLTCASRAGWVLP